MAQTPRPVGKFGSKAKICWWRKRQRSVGGFGRASDGSDSLALPVLTTKGVGVGNREACRTKGGKNKRRKIDMQHPQPSTSTRFGSRPRGLGRPPVGPGANRVDPPNKDVNGSSSV